MANNLPTLARDLEELEADLIRTLEADQHQGCDPLAIRQKSNRYAEGVNLLMTEGSPRSSYGSDDVINSFLPQVERAYSGWKAVHAAFESVIRLAYDNAVPRKNLLLDQPLADLIQSVGEPLAERYITLKSEWKSHLTNRPWDAYLEATPDHLDSDRLDRCLNALIRGDDLDVEDALIDLTGDLRHAFIDFLVSSPDSVVDIESGLWKRPEIVIAGDFWGRGRRRRLVDVLESKASPRFANAFGAIQSFFALQRPEGAEYSPGGVANELRSVPVEQRSRFYRCLMLHPDYEMRRYAVGNSSLGSVWKALTPTQVPCATILSVLEHLVGSNTYTTTQRKIFFDTVYRRLLSVTTRSDVLYARGIVRILSKLDFFLEDEYFLKITALLDYLEAKEKMYKIDDATMRKYTDSLRNEKQRVGSVETEPPVFDDIPLVILRKLARDGHFWDLLAMHPIVKIAKETIRHIYTRDRAMLVACNHRVNQEVLRAVGRRRSLFPTIRSKLTLLSNPRTPPGVSMEYLPDLGRSDVERLLRQPVVHPELRTILRKRFNPGKQ